MSIPVLLNIARPSGHSDPVELTHRALAVGLDGVGLADSPRLFPDPIVESERVLAGTTARWAGPCVLGLGLRHPATVAAALRTLAGHHPDRAVAIVGRGESSVANEDLPIPSLADYRGSMSQLRGLLRAGDHAPAHLLGAASGPRTITATAATLGGVLLDVGSAPSMVGKAVTVARAAGAAQVWIFLRAVVTRSATEAESAAAPVLGSCAARVVRSPGWYGVDEPMLAGIQGVAAAHDYHRHGHPRTHDDPTTSDARALLLSRFLVAGEERAVTRHVEDIARQGVDGLVLGGAVGGVTERLTELAVAVRHGVEATTPVTRR